MTNITRRSSIKGGIAAPSGLIGLNALFSEPPAEAEMPADTQRSSSAEQLAPAEPFSPQQTLLLDFEWLFHLGNAASAVRDFGFGLSTIEVSLVKSGQMVGHNNVNNRRVTQISRDDSSWQPVDVPHESAIDLTFLPI
jgi:beta-galactosidase